MKMFDLIFNDFETNYCHYKQVGLEAQDGSLKKTHCSEDPK